MLSGRHLQFYTGNLAFTGFFQMKEMIIEIL